jgi:hypothetical protein
MRFIPNQGQSQDGTVRFNAGSRPPDNQLPASMLKLVLERDRLAGASAAAVKTARDLEPEALDLAAKTEDDTTAAAAARAGKPIPKPVAAAKLTEDRAEAARNVTAQAAAFQATTLDCAAHGSDLKDQLDNDAGKAKVKARAQIEALADKLASAIEAAVSAGAAHDWLAGRQYEPRAQVQIREVLPAASRAQDIGFHLTGASFSAREIITNAALTVLEN